MELSKKSYPSFKQNLKLYFFEFCNRTGIHGLNYVAEPKRSIYEKAWWVLIVFTAIYLSVFTTYQTFQKWRNSPVVVSFATQHTAIWEIPFPAVTICPEIKSIRSQFNYSDLYLKKKGGATLTPNETANFEYMSLLCDPEHEVLDKNFSTIGIAALDFLYKMAPNFSDSVYEATWMGRSKYANRVSEIFTPTVTSQGICHTFNVLDRSEFFTDVVYHFKNLYSSTKSNWTIDKGYAPDSNLNAYPRRTTVHGTKGGLDLILHAPQEDLDFACGEAFQGFRVVLHPPDQVPRLKQKYFRLPLDHSVLVGIKPKIISTSEELQQYEPAERQCYFSEEKKLMFFGVYNQENCMLECLGNFTLQSCGCISMHTPKTSSIPTCGAAIKPCLERTKSLFTSRQENPETKCDCLPSCNSIDYDFEISQSRWDWKAFMEIERATNSWKEEDEISYKGAHFSHLILYYKDMQFISSERNELYGAADFWANCGGLLGLFTGFTFISLFEILYYLTIRLFFNIRMYGSRYWSGSKELMRAYKRKE